MGNTSLGSHSGSFESRLNPTLVLIQKSDCSVSLLFAKYQWEYNLCLSGTNWWQNVFYRCFVPHKNKTNKSSDTGLKVPTRESVNTGVMRINSEETKNRVTIREQRDESLFWSGRVSPLSCIDTLSWKFLPFFRHRNVSVAEARLRCVVQVVLWETSSYREN